MNNIISQSNLSKLKMKWKRLRLKEIVLFSILAILLLFAAWKVFGDESTPTSVAAKTGTEQKLVSILECIDGVGEVDVMVTETEDGEKSAVIVCQGAKDIQVLIDVREAAATALGANQKNIKVYLKKD